MKKRKYLEKLQEVKYQTIDELEPVIKNSGTGIIKILHKITNDFISEIFKKYRKERI